MKKKSIFLFLLMALPTLLLTSCLKDQEDKFDEPASIRMNSYLQNAANILKGNANGWVLNYFPHSERIYGGYSYTLKFDGSDVEVRSELDDPSEVYVSKYRLISDDGPVLTFDTYNEAMHYFATPSAGNYQGYGGEFEFIIISATAEEVILKGKKTGNLMYMHPLTTSGEEYLTKVNDVIEEMSFSVYTLSVNGQATDVSTSNRTMTFSNNDGSETATASYYFTDEGMRFYEPVEFMGETISGFDYQSDVVSYNSTGNSNVVLNGVVPPVNEVFVTGDWYLAYSKLGEFAQPYWDELKKGADGEGETIGVAAFTTFSGRFGIYLTSGVYVCFFGFEYELLGEDRIKMYYKNNGSNTQESNANWYVNYANYGYGMYPFGYDASSARTFKLVPNKVKSPTIIVLQDESEPTNVITLTSSTVNNPFEN